MRTADIMNGTRSAAEALDEYEASDGANAALAKVLHEVLACMQRTESAAQRAVSAAEAAANGTIAISKELGHLRSEVDVLSSTAQISSAAAVRAQEGVEAAVDYVRRHTKAVLSETPSSPEIPVAKRRTDPSASATPTEASGPYESDAPQSPEVSATRPTRAPTLDDLATDLGRDPSEPTSS